MKDRSLLYVGLGLLALGIVLIVVGLVMRRNLPKK